MRKVIFILSFLILQAGKSLEAASIKISFLDNKGAIQQTADFLLSRGCDQNSVNSFTRVVDWYNSSPTDLDFGKFPKRESGFYSFESVPTLLAALSRPLIYTHHPNELNCFETVILVAGSLIKTKLQPDDVSAGPFLPPITVTNNVVTAKAAATPRDAFTLINPPWWIDASKNIFNGPMQDKRICLTAAFDSFYILPGFTTKENAGNELLKLLQSSWKREGMEFPKNIKVVICYDVTMDDQNFSRAVSSHAGLLFQDDEQYVFIEKLGDCAPYVRFDFKDKNDLFLWLRGELDPTMNKDDLLFVSFNDNEGNVINEISR